VIAPGTTVAVIGIMTTTMSGITLAATETAIEILIVLAGGIEILTVLDDGIKILTVLDDGIEIRATTQYISTDHLRESAGRTGETRAARFVAGKRRFASRGLGSVRYSRHWTDSPKVHQRGAGP
jgi:hypothetical protein